MIHSISPSYLDANLGDKRLTDRFNTILGQLGQHPSGSIPQAVQSKKAVKGAYRFFRNEKVAVKSLIDSYSKQLELKGNKERLIRYLVPSDTVELDYSNKRCAADLGPLTRKTKRGIIVHNTLIMNESGAVKGLLDQKYIIRKDEDFGKSEERKRLPIEDKESFKWIEHFERTQQLCKDTPGVEMVYIGDRDADMMELYNKRKEERMHLLIRAQYDRCLKSGSISKKLSGALAKTRFAGCYSIKIIHPITLKERTARLHVRFTKQTIALHPRTSNINKNLQPVEMNIVEVVETNPPQDIEEPIHWVLFTSLPVEDLTDALQVIQYYVLRWLIERYHYLLKSGGANVEALNFKKNIV